MEVTILSNENGMATVKFAVPAEVYSKALDDMYATQKKNHPDYAVPREGICDNPEGQDICRQAVEEVFSDIYSEGIAQTGLSVASEPKVAVISADETDGAAFRLTFAVRPELKLGQYKGIHVKCPDFTLTEEEAEAAVEAFAKQNLQLVAADRPAQLGDTVTLDFAGYLDDVAFEGGTGSDYALELGSGTFIPGFEEQLVGSAAGEHTEIHVSFPENYPAANLAGKPTVFQCDIKKVETRQLMPLTEEQKAQVRKNAAEQKKVRADQEVEEQVLTRILSDAQVTIPQAMLDSEVNVCLDQFANEISQKGMSLDQFCAQTGKTPESMAEELKPLASRRIMLRLVLSAIAEAEEITATDEELNARWEAMSKQYGMPAEMLKPYFGDNADAQLAMEIVSEKAYTLLRESTILEQ